MFFKRLLNICYQTHVEHGGTIYMFNICSRTYVRHMFNICCTFSCVPHNLSLIPYITKTQQENTVPTINTEKKIQQPSKKQNNRKQKVSTNNPSNCELSYQFNHAQTFVMNLVNKFEKSNKMFQINNDLKQINHQ